MSQIEGWQNFLAGISKPALAEPLTTQSEQAVSQDFETRYRIYLAEQNGLIARCSRSPYDFSSPAEDYRRAAEHMTAWIGHCVALAPVAARLSAGGYPAFAARLDFIANDTAGALAILGQMRGAAADTASIVAKGVAAAQSATLATISRLSDELSAETDPLNVAGHRRRH